MRNAQSYVTRSGKRYISAQKFEIALLVSFERALRKLYDDANPASVASSMSRVMSVSVNAPDNALFRINVR